MANTRKRKVVEALRRFLRDPNNWVTRDDAPAVHRQKLANLWSYALDLTGHDIAAALAAARDATMSGQQPGETRAAYTQRLGGVPSLAFGTTDPFGGVDKPQHFFQVALLVYTAGGFAAWGKLIGRLYEVYDAIRDLGHEPGHSTGGYDHGDIHADDLGAEFGSQLRITPGIPIGMYLRPQGESLPGAMDRLTHEASGTEVDKTPSASRASESFGSSPGSGSSGSELAVDGGFIRYDWGPAKKPAKTDAGTPDADPFEDDPTPEVDDSGTDDSGTAVYEYYPPGSTVPSKTETSSEPPIVDDSKQGNVWEGAMGLSSGTGAYWNSDWANPSKALPDPATLLRLLEERVWANRDPVNPDLSTVDQSLPGAGGLLPRRGNVDPVDESGSDKGGSVTTVTGGGAPINYNRAFPEFVQTAIEAGASVIIVQPPGGENDPHARTGRRKGLPGLLRKRSQR